MPVHDLGMNTFSRHCGPFLLTPRLDAKLWGGRRLEQHGFELPAGESIGEAVVTHPEATIRNGPRAGERIGDLIAEDPVDALGATALRLAGNRPIFPLLVKWIDASTDLSIQVHPDDARAPAGSLGKTEAWFVLGADPDAKLYIGLDDPADIVGLATDARAGLSVGPRMRTLPARPGEVVFLPAGTIHALGAGVLVYEIQQPSTITYRLDDWGRVDDQGNPRELHVEEALAVSKPALLPNLVQPPIRHAGDPPAPCVLCEEFALELIELRSGESMTLPPEAGPAVFTTIAGAAELATSSESVDLPHGETAVMLATAGSIRLATVTGGRVLRGWIP